MNYYDREQVRAANGIAFGVCLGILCWATIIALILALLG